MAMILYGKNDPRNDDDPYNPGFPFRLHRIQTYWSSLPRIKGFTIKIPILKLFRWFKKRKKK